MKYQKKVTQTVINDMIEKKLKERFEQMETQWEQKLEQVTKHTETISIQADIVNADGKEHM